MCNAEALGCLHHLVACGLQGTNALQVTMRLRDRLYISTEIREGAKVPHAFLHAHCVALLHAVVASTVYPVQLPVTRQAPC